MPKTRYSSGDHYIVLAQSAHEFKQLTVELLVTGLWRVANIAAPIGCGSYTETIDASPVNLEHIKTKPSFWAVLERV